mgnify:CR=1 FL=1
MCIVATFRFLLTGETAPNAAKLVDSLVEDYRFNFDASDCEMKVRWTSSSKRMFVSIAVLSDLTVAMAVLSNDVWEGLGPT